MTKLEELRAAYEAAYTVYFDALDALLKEMEGTNGS